MRARVDAVDTTSLRCGHGRDGVLALLLSVNGLDGYWRDAAPRV